MDLCRGVVVVLADPAAPITGNATGPPLLNVGQGQTALAVVHAVVLAAVTPIRIVAMAQGSRIQ